MIVIHKNAQELLGSVAFIVAMDGRPDPLPADVSLGTTFLVLACILTFFSLLMTGVRVWVRRANGVIGWDDYTLVIVCVILIFRLGVQIESVKHGNGRHVWYIENKEDYEWVVMANWYTQICLFPAICLLKISICLLLLRIKDSKVVKQVIYTIIAGLVLTNILPLIVLFAQCSPLKTFWEPKAGKCWTPKVRIYSIYIQASYSVLTDLICSLMPIFVVYKLQIELREKVLICSLMSLGLIATICAAIRASSLGTAVVDLSWDYCIAAIWANVELHLGVIAANLACGRAIYRFFTNGCTPGNTSKNRLSSHNHSNTGYFQTSQLSGTTNSDPQILTNVTGRAKDTSEFIEIPDYPNIKMVQEFTFYESRPSIDDENKSTMIARPEKSYNGSNV